MITTHIHGEARVEDGVGIVTLTSVYPTSVEDLWDAITTPERLARWFGNVEPDADNPRLFRGDLITTWSGTIEVIECERPRVLRTTFSDEDGTGPVTATLESVPNGAKLIIEERGVPADNLDAYVAGWRSQLELLAPTL